MYFYTYEELEKILQSSLFFKTKIGKSRQQKLKQSNVRKKTFMRIFWGMGKIYTFFFWKTKTFHNYTSFWLQRIPHICLRKQLFPIFFQCRRNFTSLTNVYLSFRKNNLSCTFLMRSRLISTLSSLFKTKNSLGRVSLSRHDRLKNITRRVSSIK